MNRGPVAPWAQLPEGSPSASWALRPASFSSLFSAAVCSAFGRFEGIIALRIRCVFEFAHGGGRGQRPPYAAAQSGLEFINRQIHPQGGKTDVRRM